LGSRAWIGPASKSTDATSDPSRASTRPPNGGEWKGRQIAGFIAPGIGFGEVVCSPDQQWIRLYPSNGGRESAMVTWTDKDWGNFREVALREAKYSTGTGPDIKEGFNKSGPTEK
jgi:hypothetical protein